MKRIVRVGALGVLILLASAAAGLVFARRVLFSPWSFAAPAEGRAFDVKPGEATRGILERLERAGIVRSAWMARFYQSRVLGDPPLRAGEYRFTSPLSTAEVLRILRSGEVVTHPVTLVEGMTYQETAQALATAGFGKETELEAEFKRPGRVHDLDPAARNLEGYLFPDTYRFPHGISASAITDALVGGFRRHWEQDIRPNLSPGDLRPPREILILASLVEKEARRAEERPLVAAVYANRLRRGIGLYADPTIIYGLKLAGRWDGNLRKRDLEADSPWNTYRRPGLPPGPICSPGLASLRAAAHPATVDYLYFVSRNDGSHVFAKTLSEHNRNVETWQRRYFRERRHERPRD